MTPRKLATAVICAAFLACLTSPALAAPASGSEVIVKQGRILSDRPDWVYVPFEVPRGVRELKVAYEYDRAGGANVLDIGVFDPDGYELGNARGFRGWSGGARSEFTISRTEATPGYVPGRIEPGEWNLILGPYQVAPQGLDWKATITLTYGRPGPRFRPNPAPRFVGSAPGWYRGDLHVHTVHSDGSWTPEEMVSGASAAGLDFIVSTEHNTTTANQIWGRHARRDLLIIAGEEVTTRAGHFGALGLTPRQWIDWRYRPEDGELPRFLRQIHRVGGLAIANHPYCPFKGCDWRFGYSGIDAIEVWNGPWTFDDGLAVQLWDALLRLGLETLAAGGASDSHRPGQTIGLPQTVVGARALSRSAILEGVGAGRSYLAGSAAVVLDLRAASGWRRAGLGDELSAPPDAAVDFALRVRGAAGSLATWHTPAGTVATQAVAADDQRLTFTTTPSQARYVRVELRRPDGTMVALTNPVFLRPG